MVSSCRNEQQVVRGRGENLTINIVISLPADEKKQFAMIVDVIEVNALCWLFNPLMRYLQDLIANFGLKHKYHRLVD